MVPFLCFVPFALLPHQLPPALCGFESLNTRLCSPHLFRLPLEPALHRQVNSVLKCTCFSLCPICLTCLFDRDNPFPDVCSFPAGRVWTCRQTCTRRPKVTQFVSVTGTTTCRTGAISSASLLQTFRGTFVTRNLISCLKNPWSLAWFVFPSYLIQASVTYGAAWWQQGPLGLLCGPSASHNLAELKRRPEFLQKCLRAPGPPRPTSCSFFSFAAAHWFKYGRCMEKNVPPISVQLTGEAAQAR